MRLLSKLVVLVVIAASMVMADGINPSKNLNVKLRSLTRQMVVFVSDFEGKMQVSIENSRGETVASYTNESARSGLNVMNWDGVKMPAGTYQVSFKHNDYVYDVAVDLK